MLLTFSKLDSFCQAVKNSEFVLEVDQNEVDSIEMEEENVAVDLDDDDVEDELVALEEEDDEVTLELVEEEEETLDQEIEFRDENKIVKSQGRRNKCTASNT